MSATERSIYDLIGGEEALVDVVDDFHARVLADPALRPFFAGVPCRFKSHQMEFFGEALGGPHPYTGAPLREAHHGRGIQRRHFDLVAAHLVDALLAAGVAPPIVGEIISVILPLAPEIISQPLMA